MFDRSMHQVETLGINDGVAIFLLNLTVWDGITITFHETWFVYLVYLIIQILSFVLFTNKN